MRWRKEGGTEQSEERKEGDVKTHRLRAHGLQSREERRREAVPTKPRRGVTRRASVSKGRADTGASTGAFHVGPRDRSTQAIKAPIQPVDKRLATYTDIRNSQNTVHYPEENSTTRVREPFLPTKVTPGVSRWH